MKKILVAKRKEKEQSKKFYETGLAKMAEVKARAPIVRFGERLPGAGVGEQTTHAELMAGAVVVRVGGEFDGEFGFTRRAVQRHGRVRPRHHELRHRRARLRRHGIPRPHAGGVQRHR